MQTLQARLQSAPSTTTAKKGRFSREEGCTFWGDGRRDASLRFGLRCFWQSWWRCRRLESVGLAFCDGMGKARWMGKEARGAGLFKLCWVVCALSISWSSNLGGRRLRRSVVRVLCRNITSDHRLRRIPDYSISRKHIVRMDFTLEKTRNPNRISFIYYFCLYFYFPFPNSYLLYSNRPPIIPLKSLTHFSVSSTLFPLLTPR